MRRDDGSVFPPGARVRAAGSEPARQARVIPFATGRDDRGSGEVGIAGVGAAAAVLRAWRAPQQHTAFPVAEGNSSAPASRTPTASFVGLTRQILAGSDYRSRVIQPHAQERSCALQTR